MSEYKQGCDEFQLAGDVWRCKVHGGEVPELYYGVVCPRAPAPVIAHKHTDECWEPGSGCDMGRNEAYAARAGEQGAVAWLCDGPRIGKWVAWTEQDAEYGRRNGDTVSPLFTRSAQGWIPVSTGGGPSIGADCWVVIKTEDGSSFVANAERHSDGWYCDDADRFVDWGEVTHWQPYFTPAAPTGGERDE